MCIDWPQWVNISPSSSHAPLALSPECSERQLGFPHDVGHYLQISYWFMAQTYIP